MKREKRRMGEGREGAGGGEEEKRKEKKEMQRELKNGITGEGGRAS